MKDFNKKNKYGTQTIPILIKVEERDQWAEWLVCGVYVLNQETGEAIHLGGQKTPTTYKNMRKESK